MKKMVFLLLFLGLWTLQAQENKWQGQSVNFKNGKHCCPVNPEVINFLFVKS
jgi:hypothetical protein